MINREDLPFISNVLSLHNTNVDTSFMHNVLTAIKDNEYMQKDILDSLSNNQFKSKLKLLDIINHLDILDVNTEIVIFGSWFGSILLPNLSPIAKKITCIDLEEDVLKIAKNKLFPYLNNVDYIPGNVFEKDLSRYHTCDLFVNTSCEHMQPMKEWPFWSYVKSGSIYAFQSNNMYQIDTHINCVSSIDEFKEQMPKNLEILCEHELEEERGTRFSLVGKIIKNEGIE